MLPEVRRRGPAVVAARRAPAREWQTREPFPQAIGGCRGRADLLCPYSNFRFGSGGEVAGPSVKLEEFLARLDESPCCAAITSDGRLEAALTSGASMLFILRGDGLELRLLVALIHDAG